MDRVSPAYCGPGAPSPKESVWALYCRSLLLWNFCNRLLSHAPHLRRPPPQQLSGNSDALQEAWNEAQAIEDGLEMHVCNYETGVAYLCQEYVYKYAPALILFSALVADGSACMQYTHERHSGSAQVRYLFSFSPR